jgi:hypothetical protein
MDTKQLMKTIGGGVSHFDAAFSDEFRGIPGQIV